MTPELLALVTRVLVGRMCAEHWQNTSTTVTSIVTNYSLLAVVYRAIVHVHYILYLSDIHVRVIIVIPCMSVQYYCCGYTCIWYVMTACKE